MTVRSQVVMETDYLEVGAPATAAQAAAAKATATVAGSAIFGAKDYPGAIAAIRAHATAAVAET